MTCTVTYTARARRDLTGLPPISANFIDNYLPADGALYSGGTEEGRANRG